MIFSIDQNCHSLWDVAPKCQALAAAGCRVRHFVEDIDVAFTALGAGTAAGTPLRLARERYHHSGGADWGAALFYSAFLGRLPVDVRWWEPYTGIKTAALARQLGRTVEDLYEEFSPADTWQLIGPSYVGDRRHHRMIADLAVAETAEFLRELMAKARADMLHRFPQPAAQRRIEEWFAAETARLEKLLDSHAGGKLVDLYRAWLGQLLGGSVELDVASSLAALSAEAPAVTLLEMFCANYARATQLYNQALRETDIGTNPLDVDRGELPFFAALLYQGHLVRTDVQYHDGALHVADASFPLAGGRVPLEALRAAGLVGLAGKAVMLAVQVRWGPGGAELALPRRGSFYMPAAQRLGALLRREGLLTGPIRALVRVRFRLLDRIRSLDTVIRLPDHLAACFDTAEVPARRLGEQWEQLTRQAAARLEQFKTDPGRRAWQRESFGVLTGEIDRLDARRRELSAREPTSPALREVWKQLKPLHRDLVDATLRQIARDWQVGQADYWDSRGALWPWCVALGGQEFYNQVIAQAEITRESPPDGDE
ncbi:MAG: hypothetical protein MUP47_08495 [Phycisphaerae bacterium]|nr:hypothetical protein [Phycisphaerae bacterium]